MKKQANLVPVDPSTHPICEVVVRGLCCGAPAVVCDLDSPREPEERDDWPGFLCAHHARREEVDSYLEEIGAVVIQVEDLGAALEARHQGGRDAHRITVSRGMGPFTDIELDGLARDLSKRATATAHLARVALGEVES